MNGNTQQPSPTEQQKQELRKLFQFLRAETADSPKTVAKHNEIGQALQGLEAFVNGQFEHIESLQNQIDMAKEPVKPEELKLAN